MNGPDYRLIDHTSDIGFEVEGADFPDLLRKATAALSDVIRAFDGAAPNESHPVAVLGDDREDVLVLWLSEVVILLEEDGFLAREAVIERADATGAQGHLRGRRLEETEPPDRVVKAVTYHDLSVEAGVGSRPWRATVVLDL